MALSAPSLMCALPAPPSTSATSTSEGMENMKVKDLHDNELKYLEENMEDPLEKLGVVQKEKENLMSTLSLAASRMVAFCNQIYNIACNNCSLAQGDAAEYINATIWLFERLAADLGHAGKRLEDLKKDKVFHKFK